MKIKTIWCKVYGNRVVSLIQYDGEEGFVYSIEDYYPGE